MSVICVNCWRYGIVEAERLVYDVRHLRELLAKDNGAKVGIGRLQRGVH
jgi:hypothetical protein